MTSEMPNAINPKPPSASGWLAIPAPLARLFKKFPLLTYPPNELPARSPHVRDVATLYVHISDQDALNDLPSFNPSCLKWQAFLKFAGVDFQVVPSNNHASPSGALPFLIPPSNPSSPTTHAPIPSNKLEQYATEKGTSKMADVDHAKLELYESLIDHRIRNAWLYSLYLSRRNSALLSDLYIAPASASQIIRRTKLHQLRQAAEAEILKSIGTPAVDASTLYDLAKHAFRALDDMLGDNDWFFGTPAPTIFDATVFSYTHPLLDENLHWENQELTDIVMAYPNLVDHRNRILLKYWGVGG